MTERNPHDRTAEGGPNLINHIAFVLDASTSMTHLTREVVEVADAEIKHLAEVTRENGQETRVTVYVFHDDVYCLIYDKDVLRLPSLRDLYRAQGNTALVAATMKATEDLAKTADTYGDHAYLVYVLTDGEENVSQWSRVFGGDGQRRFGLGGPSQFTRSEVRDQLATRLGGLPENWSVAALVPNRVGVDYAADYGFPRENIAVWDATRGAGVQEAFSATMRSSTQTFMTNRTKGIRGSKTLFAGGVDQINREARAAAGLTALARDDYTLYDVHADGVEIRPFVETATNAAYRAGSAFYQLMKPEKIQPQKDIMIRDRKSGRVYRGTRARDLLGLPNHEVRVKPEGNPQYTVFVQSTSVNRKLVAGTKLLVLAETP